MIPSLPLDEGTPVTISLNSFIIVKIEVLIPRRGVYTLGHPADHCSRISVGRPDLNVTFNYRDMGNIMPVVFGITR